MVSSSQWVSKSPEKWGVLCVCVCVSWMKQHANVTLLLSVCVCQVWARKWKANGKSGSLSLWRIFSIAQWKAQENDEEQFLHQLCVSVDCWWRKKRERNNWIEHTHKLCCFASKSRSNPLCAAANWLEFQVSCYQLLAAAHFSCSFLAFFLAFFSLSLGVIKDNELGEKAESESSEWSSRLRKLSPLCKVYLMPWKRCDQDDKIKVAQSALV